MNVDVPYNIDWAGTIVNTLLNFKAPFFAGLYQPVDILY